MGRDGGRRGQQVLFRPREQANLLDTPKAGTSHQSLRICFLCWFRTSSASNLTICHLTDCINILLQHAPMSQSDIATIRRPASMNNSRNEAHSADSEKVSRSCWYELLMNALSTTDVASVVTEFEMYYLIGIGPVMLLLKHV